MNIRIPPFIKPGDTIGITAPSFGATTEPYITLFKNAVEEFKKRGYKVKTGETCSKSDGLGISTDPKTAARELEEFYLDESVSCIISCGGGELMCETIGFVDFEKIKNAPPKWFLGYSDNTNFIFPLVTQCGVCAVYGPNATGFGKIWEQTENDTFGILEGKVRTVKTFEKFQMPGADAENPAAPYILTEKKEFRIFNENRRSNVKTPQPQAERAPDGQSEFLVSGVLTGGCLDVLVGLSGTKFDSVSEFIQKNSEKGIIWALEACDYNTMDIRRAMWHLKECGWFKNAKAFLIGRPLASFRQEMMGVDQYNAVTDILSDLNVPVVMDFDIGHIDPVIPLVMGSDCTVKVRGNTAEVTFF